MTSMRIVTTSSPFGSRTRTRVLLGLELLGESYPREIARILGVSLSVVQKAIRSLELDGLIAGRAIGRTRLYTINPAYFALRELRPLLARLATNDEDLKGRTGGKRSRPRRSGKPL